MNWKYINITFCAASFVQSLVSAIRLPRESTIAIHANDPSGTLVNIAIAAGMILLTKPFFEWSINLSAKLMPENELHWEKPTLASAPFKYSHPLNFTRFVGALILCSGLGFLVAAPVNPVNGLIDGALFTAAGAQILRAVDACHKKQAG